MPKVFSGRMSEGEKMLWSATVAAWVKSWHDQGQPESFSKMMIFAVTEASAVVEAVRALQKAPLDRSAMHMLRDVINDNDADEF